MHPQPISVAHEIVELRQYTLRPKQRDVLIELFDREFIESQEAVGIRVLGQFRDVDDPDKFVWLRSFPDMRSRAESLSAFYDGPVWHAHREAANATMIDSDNVLLLRLAWADSGISHDPRKRALSAASSDANALTGNVEKGFVHLAIFYLKPPALDDNALIALCRDQLQATLLRGGALASAWYVTEPSRNTFPRLPVRESERALVNVALYPDLPAFESTLHNTKWQQTIVQPLRPWLSSAAEIHGLTPTHRSAFHA
jgi:hypothetical protein